MPTQIRLPAHVNDDELRVYWDNTPDGGDDLYVYGPRSIRLFALAMFREEPLQVPDMMRAYELVRDGVLIKGPSPLEELEAAGWDPKTIVFSIRRKDAAVPPDDRPDDILKHAEDAQAELEALSRLVDEATEAKGVYVFSDGEIDKLRDGLSEASVRVEAVLDILLKKALPGSSSD